VLDAGTQDTVKLSVGLVATMTAVLLSLLVSSEKSSYDDQRQHVRELAASIAVLDRLLSKYGDGGAEVRASLRTEVEVAVARAWPQQRDTSSELGTVADTAAMVEVIQQLVPQSPLQTEIRGQALTLALDIAQSRSLLIAEGLRSTLSPPLILIVSWLIVILLGFSLIAPRNPVAFFALLIAAASACGAIFLLLELRHPFDGVLRISSAPLTEALGLPGS
jgi:hypothetical protein